MHTSQKRWPRDFRNRFFIGMHTPDYDQNATIPGLLSEMDGRDIIKRLADAGVEAVYFYSSCHCGNCFYPTETPLAHMHSGLKGRDVFGEAAEECQKQGMAFIAVYEFMNWRLKEFGPREWQHYYPTPAPNAGSTAGFSGMCWNTGYGEFVAHQLEEVSRRYPIAGFYVDMLNHPGLACCAGCASLFKDAAGVAPPRLVADTPLYKAFKLWAYEDEARYLRELRKIVQTHQPAATVVNNILLFDCEDLYEVPAANDYITHDTAIVFGSSRGAAYQSALVNTYRSIGRGKLPFEVLSDPIVYGLLSVSPLDTYNAVTALVRQQGGIAGYPSSMLDRVGRLNEPVLALTKKVNEFVNARQAWQAAGEPLRFAGVYLSQETEIFQANLAPLKRNQELYLHSFMGACRVAQEEHLPLDILTRRDLQRLEEYPVVILANTACMSNREAEAFRLYVENGGTLISSYQTSLYNEWSEPRPNFALADVLGVDYAGRVVRPRLAVQLKLCPDIFPIKSYENSDVTLPAPSTVCEIRPGAEVLAFLHERHGRDPNNISTALFNAYTCTEPLGPGITLNRFGKGRSIYCSGKIFAAYLMTGIPALRKLMARWVIEAEIAEQCILRLKAPSSVEMAAWSQPEKERVLVHLVNYQSSPGRLQSLAQGLPLTEDVLPVHDLELHAAFKPDQLHAAFLQPSGERLIIQSVGSGVVIKIPKVHINEIVELQMKPGACPVYPAGNQEFDYPRLDYRAKIQAWLKTNPPEYDPYDDGNPDFSKWLPTDVFLTEWSVLGLFKPPNAPDLTLSGSPDFNAIYTTDDGGKTSWQTLRGPVQCADGCVELAVKCGNRVDTVGFAMTFLKSDKEQKVSFRLGDDDHSDIYLNGKKVFHSGGVEAGGLASAPDYHAFTAELKAGVNVLLVRKLQIGHGYKFYLRIDKAQHPLWYAHQPSAVWQKVKVHSVETAEWDGKGAGQV